MIVQFISYTQAYSRVQTPEQIQGNKYGYHRLRLWFMRQQCYYFSVQANHKTWTPSATYNRLQVMLEVPIWYARAYPNLDHGGRWGPTPSVPP